MGLFLYVRFCRLEVKTEFTADKTVKSKTVSIGIGAEFRFEILFGLITIHGGASYLRSETKTNTEEIFIRN